MGQGEALSVPPIVHFETLELCGRASNPGGCASTGFGGAAARWAGRLLLAVGTALAIGACSSLPPGHDFPRVASSAFAGGPHTRLGKAFAGVTADHAPTSGFRLIAAGTDGLAMRMQLIASAERSLDLQYFIFRGDDTGGLLTAAILDSADRGVHVRILIDDGDTEDGDDRVLALMAHPSIEVRIFNPFAYRGHSEFLRGIEYSLDFGRLDYRMHNKLLVADGSVALVGGRNLSDPYFQVSPESQFADDDVAAVGPIVPRLSAVFDEFWNNALAIPAQALSGGGFDPGALAGVRARLADERLQWDRERPDYLRRVASGEPLAGLLEGRLPLVWANVKLVYDSPDKREVSEGAMVGRLMHRAVAHAAEQVQSELIMVTPYLIPGQEGMRIFSDLRRRKVQVRLLTNSLESTTELLAQSGYMRFRVPLLEEGVDLYEVRARLGDVRGSGENAAMAGFGTYGLHAKMFVFDRREVFIGSMNFDQRSMHLNTEIGLLIESPVLAEQVAARFAAMTQKENAYTVVLRPDSDGRGRHLAWLTREGGADVEFTEEPERKAFQRFRAQVLSHLPIDREL
jgi:putative cardiolipin synthase